MVASPMCQKQLLVTAKTAKNSWGLCTSRASRGMLRRFTMKSFCNLARTSIRRASNVGSTRIGFKGAKRSLALQEQKTRLLPKRNDRPQ